jgi:hypothetical protein
MNAIATTALMCLALSGTSPADDPKPNDETLGKKPPEGAVVLFDGGDLEGWVAQGDPSKPAEWPVSGPVFTVGGGKGNIRTKDTFGSCDIHLEFACPYEPDDHGQARGNSGVYLGGVYELQVLDSYGLDPQTNDCGAIYQQHKPAVNACKPPLQWQTYDITFKKAKVEDGKVVAKARLTVLQNGLKILDDVEIDPTPGNVPGFEAGKDGPLMLQDHGDAVQYRNIWLVPAKD